MPLKILSTEWKAKWPKGSAIPVAVIILAAVLLLPVLYVGIYNHPCPADDYHNAAWDNFIDTQIILYINWSGRYFNNLLLSLCPLHWHSFLAYRVVIILLIGLFAVVFAGVVRQALLAYTNASGIACTAAAAGAVLLIINNMASLAEGFFWYSGAATYAMPAVVMGGFLAIAIRLDHKADGKPPIGLYILSVILVASIIGSNEILLVFCDAVCFCLFLHYRQRKSVSLCRFYLLLCGICLLCSAIAILAPGNAARQNVNPRNLWMVAPTWIYFTQKLAIKWLLDPFLLVYSVLFLVLFSRYTLKKQVTNLFAAFLIPVALLFLLSFPGHYALGTAPPPRVVNLIFIFFVLAWIFFLLHLSLYLNTLIVKAGTEAPALKQILFVVTIICLLASFNTHDLRKSNLFMVIKGLAKGIPQAYNNELNHRYMLIRQTASDTVMVPKLRMTEHNVLYLADIISNPASGANRSCADYWHKAGIYVSPDTLFHAGTGKQVK